VDPADRTRRRLAVLTWSAAAVYAGAIFAFSSLSNPLPGLVLRLSDKVLHAIEYAGLSLLITLALLASNVSVRRALAIAVVAASLYAATDELHQRFVPGRHRDPWDWVADTIGAGLAAALGSGVARLAVGQGRRPAGRAAVRKPDRA
jgi:VanZ family protein